MEEHLNKGIKEIIDEYPEIAQILNEYEIGCSSCDVGICRLKDIVALHPLSKTHEEELVARISAVISRKPASPAVN